MSDDAKAGPGDYPWTKYGPRDGNFYRAPVEITELGEPTAAAMFSDRYVDLEHMPREVSSDAIELAALADADIAPGVRGGLVLVAAILVVVGVFFAAGLFSPHG
jgi:hypothetical protein